MGFATDAIHAGQEPDPTTGAIMTPIYQTSTYVLEELGKSKGFDYARTINPTVWRSRRTLRRWKEAGRAFASPREWRPSRR
jgi:cystathionine beta-lyase/cystathionine gamma-synthase